MELSYKIVVDSSCELDKELVNDSRFKSVPLFLIIGEEQIVDDKTFKQKEFLEKIAAYPKCPQSSCPSPQTFMEAYQGDEDMVFVVTLSSKLSGTYNSAMLGVGLYKEQHGGKNIFVVDSESASCGETQIAMKLLELAESGLAFEEIVERIQNFRDEMNTYFVLDNLETLRKNGRMSGVKSFVTSTLNIKPVMGAQKGDIVLRTQSIGVKKALTKMADLIIEEVENPMDKTMRISQCNCPERAELMKSLLEQKGNFKEIKITQMGGLSSLYANDGGIICAI